ncbi:SgcJ/EcaC family oxidoreductase [Reyranella sp. CPCC 100927]|uniref:YybH family protein n=1 Tax=Reyranella sp. CPCC 100927 TaxID=2599616 RepID=UPI0015B4F27B|nr:SgcJ/EcaC family oxidoreductase [Reyranella sp. CPCC 100927]
MAVVMRVEDMAGAFAEAFSAGNLDSLTSLYEENAVLAPQPGARVVGKAAIREAFARMTAQRPRMTMTAAMIMERDGLALVRHDWVLTGTDAAGKPTERKGTSAEVLRRQPDGRWLYVLDHPTGVDKV